MWEVKLRPWVQTMQPGVGSGSGMEKEDEGERQCILGSYPGEGPSNS